MDKFNKIFEAGMQDSLDKLEEGDIIKISKRKTRNVALGAIGGAGIGSVVPSVRLGTRIARGSADFKKMNPRMMDEVIKKTAAKTIRATKIGAIAGAGTVFGIAKLRKRIAKNNKAVTESVLEQVRDKVRGKMIEEGVLDGLLKGVKSLKGLKVVKQTGTMGRAIKGAALSGVAKFKQGGSTFGSLKGALGSEGKYIGTFAKANPLGAATIGGGAAAGGGVTAWGLKKPKKQRVQEGTLPDFLKKKGVDKGKDKDKAKGGFPFGKGKGKGGKVDTPEPGDTSDKAALALDMAKKKAKGKGKKGLPAAFLKNQGRKGGDSTADNTKDDGKSF